jgi:hypothetical protein
MEKSVISTMSSKTSKSKLSKKGNIFFLSAFIR